MSPRPPTSIAKPFKKTTWFGYQLVPETPFRKTQNTKHNLIWLLIIPKIPLKNITWFGLPIIQTVDERAVDERGATWFGYYQLFSKILLKKTQHDLAYQLFERLTEE
jgi:hypothetical protein